jgi:hypothetical protein
MISEKCPDCGAGVAPNATVCSYCGATFAQSNAMGKWTAMKDHLPPVSPTDPNRSINVLGCFGMNGGRLKQKDGTMLDTYGMSLKSIYYDFQSKQWKNDFYGQRAEPIIVTHWMHIPSIGLPDWIPVILRTPQIPGNDDGFSINVLVCDKSIDYDGSVISAKVLFRHNTWYGTLDTIDTSESSKLGEITVSHWMPVPERPAG